MKKNKKNKFLRFIFMMLFLCFMVIYCSELAGYYEYKNYQKKELTSEQIKQFEEDVANGEKIDLNKYLVVENKTYNNKLSRFASKLSNFISESVEGGVKYIFKILSNIVDED